MDHQFTNDLEIRRKVSNNQPGNTTNILERISEEFVAEDASSTDQEFTVKVINRNNDSSNDSDSERILSEPFSDDDDFRGPSKDRNSESSSNSSGESGIQNSRNRTFNMANREVSMNSIGLLKARRKDKNSITSIVDGHISREEDIDKLVNPFYRAKTQTIVTKAKFTTSKDLNTSKTSKRSKYYLHKLRIRRWKCCHRC